MSGQCQIHSVQGRKIWLPSGEGGNAAQISSGFMPGGSNGAREAGQLARWCGGQDFNGRPYRPKCANTAWSKDTGLNEKETRNASVVRGGRHGWAYKNQEGLRRVSRSFFAAYFAHKTGELRSLRSTSRRWKRETPKARASAQMPGIRAARFAFSAGLLSGTVTK